MENTTFYRDFAIVKTNGIGYAGQSLSKIRSVSPFIEFSTMTTIRQVALYLIFFLYLCSTAEGSSKPEEIIPMLGCRACHRLSGKGGQLGPNLSGIGQRMTRRELRQILMSRDEENTEHHMPRYDYLFESEWQQLLDSLEQQ
jgi:hypothetical protein